MGNKPNIVLKSSKASAFGDISAYRRYYRLSAQPYLEKLIARNCIWRICFHSDGVSRMHAVKALSHERSMQ